MDLSGGLAAVATRYEFVFLEPREIVYEVPATAGGGHLGMGVQFL